MDLLASDSVVSTDTPQEYNVRKVATSLSLTRVYYVNMYMEQLGYTLNIASPEFCIIWMDFCFLFFGGVNYCVYMHIAH